MSKQRPWTADTRRRIIRDWLDELRKAAPTSKPVRLGKDLPPLDRVRPMRGDVDLAKITYTGKTFTIRLAANLSRYESQDALLHEYAHALTWFTDKDPTDHGDRWGAAVARCYRALICE